MLRQRPAGDKSWPVACGHTTLGEVGKELDLNGAHLSYGDFEGVSFQGKGVIKLNEAGLAHADLSNSKISAVGKDAQTIDFSGANMSNADLSGLELTASLGQFGPVFSLICRC